MPAERIIEKDKHYYIKQEALGNYQDNFLQNLQGIFLTSPVQNKYQIAFKAFNLIKEHTDAIPNALEESEYRLERLEPGAKGTMFVYWPEIEGEDTPQEVYYKLNQKRKDGYNFDKLSAILPINVTCSTEPRYLDEGIEKVLSMFEGKFGICVKVRNNTGLSKDEVVLTIKEIAGDRVVEDYKYQGIIFVVQICECNAMIGYYDNEK